jgi:gas vesicle protein
VPTVDRAEKRAIRADKRAAKKAGRRRRRGGFVFGAMAGAAAGLLLAPRSGKETRAQLFGGEGNLGDQVGRLKSAVGAGKESAADQSEALRSKIEETRERLRSQMDAGGEDAPGADPVA